MGTSRCFSILLGFCRGFIVPTLLGPSNYGVWKGISMIADFSRFPQLGISSSMLREVPILRAQEKQQELDTVFDTCFTINLLNGCFVSAIVLFASFFVHDKSIATPLRLYAALLFLSEAFLFMKIYFSALKEFIFLSKINTIDAIVGLAIVTVSTWYFGLNGLIVGISVEMLIILSLFYYKLERKPRLKIEFEICPRLIRIGLPLMLSGLLLQILLSVDKIIILKFFNRTQLGYYALGLTIIHMLYQLFSTINSVISPRLMEKFGEEGRMESIQNYLTKPMLAMAFLSPVFLVPMYFFSDSIYHQFFPKFSPGYNAFRILLLTAFFTIITIGLNSFFTAIKKQLRIVYLQVATILTAFVANYIAINLVYNITSVATATAIVMFLYSVIIISYALSHHFKKMRQIICFYLTLILPLAYSLLVIYLIERYFLDSHIIELSLTQSFYSVVIFIIIYTPVSLVGSKLVLK